MALAARPRIGLSSVVYALMTDEVNETYGTIYPLAHAMDLTYDPASSLASLFTDDGLGFVAETTGEQTIGLGNADILPADYARLLGNTYANGGVAYNTLDQSPYVALGYKTLRTGKDGSNLVYDYTWLYKCKFKKPSFDAKTKGNAIEYQTIKLEGLVAKLANNDYMFKVRTDDATLPAATLAGFFSTVTLPTTSLTAVTVGVIAGASGAKTITIPFAKSGETFLMQDGSDAQITVSVVSTGALLAGTNTFTKSVAGVAPTIIIANTSIAAVAYLVSVTSNVKDTNGISVTPKSQLVTPA